MAAALVAALTIASTASARVTRIPHRCVVRPAPVLCAIRFHHARTNALRARMGLQPRAYHWMAEAHPALRPRLLRYWRHVHGRTLRRWHHYQAVAATSPTAAIEAAFGASAGEALRVAQCESGLSVHATNGQYYGLFQLSEYIRYSRPGIPHAGASDDAGLQARAAAAVYYQDGASWREWTCQP